MKQNFETVAESLKRNIVFADGMYQQTYDPKYIEIGKRSRSMLSLVRKAQKKFPAEKFRDVRFSEKDGVKRYDKMLGEWIVIASIPYLASCG